MATRIPFPPPPARKRRDVDVAPELPSHCSDRLKVRVNSRAVSSPTPENPLGLPLAVQQLLARADFGLKEIQPLIQTTFRFWLRFNTGNPGSVGGLTRTERMTLNGLTQKSILPDGEISPEALPLVQANEIRGRLVLIFKSGVSLDAAAKRLRALRDIDWAEKAVRLYPTFSQPDPIPARPARTKPTDGLKVTQESVWWGRDMVYLSDGNGGDTEEAKTLNPLVLENIAVLDSGVDVAHSVLQDGAIRIPTHSYFPRDVKDKYGHGTHVCSIIAARPKDDFTFKDGWQADAHLPAGVLPSSRVLVFNIFDQINGEFQVNMQAFHTALFTIRYKHKEVKAINLSIWMKYRPDPDILSDFGKLETQGVVIVACSTNQWDSSPGMYPPWWDSRFRVQFPARLKNILSVGAIDESSTRAYFSRYTTFGTNDQNGNDFYAFQEDKKPFVDLMAPGVRIWGATPSLGTTDFVANQARLKGTSMAAPYVTAAVASLMSQMPNEPPAKIRELIRTCVDDSSVPSAESGQQWETSIWTRDELYGSGVLDFRKVVALAWPPPPSTE